MVRARTWTLPETLSWTSGRHHLAVASFFLLQLHPRAWPLPLASQTARSLPSPTYKRNSSHLPDLPHYRPSDSDIFRAGCGGYRPSGSLMACVRFRQVYLCWRIVLRAPVKPLTFKKLHARTHAHAHTHTHTHTHTHRHTHIRTDTHTHTLSLSLSHTGNYAKTLRLRCSSSSSSDGSKTSVRLPRKGCVPGSSCGIDHLSLRDLRDPAADFRGFWQMTEPKRAYDSDHPRLRWRRERERERQAGRQMH